jgi:predicted amidohydrolase
LTNWAPQDPEFIPSCAKWKTYLEKYQALAKELSISIVPGTLVEVHNDEESGEQKLWNVAYFIGPDGEIIGRYVKKNLWLASIYSTAPTLLTLWQAPRTPPPLI